MATRARLPILAVLTITLAAAVCCGTCPPAPPIASLSPSSATAGGSQLPLTVNGNGFRRDFRDRETRMAAACPHSQLLT
jgi:hypothetical protein